ncbi:uncharacterized protein [Watersipora subatra]|uniref:uncharacterized protein n=1 Tax=Watersipora subatra TaxID=2589382 RepID=UPI00355B9F95
MAWLGCHTKRSFEISNEDRDLYMQYESEVNKFLLVYRIDLNGRSCRLDSDSALLYSDYTTGWDTCTTISSQLKQCDCQSILNLESGDCLPLPYYSNTNCLNNNYTMEKFELSSYGITKCGNKFFYTPLSENRTSQQCMEYFSNPSNCVRVYDYEFKQDLTLSFPSIHCAPRSLTRCSRSLISDVCISGVMFDARASSASSYIRTPKISLLNAVAVSYSPSKFNFSIRLDKISIDGFEQVFATFTNKPLRSCSEYSLVNESRQEWLVCNGNSLYDVSNNIEYKDFLLRGAELRVCTNYVELEFGLYTYNYVFSALSVVSIIGYTTYYFVKAKMSVTGNFVISSLITLAAALICYCLVYTGSFNGCRVIATLNQYLLISVQVWTNAIGIWMVRGISTLRKASDSGVKTYIGYAAYAWLTPVVFVILAHILHSVKVDIFYPVFTDSFCLIPSGWTRLLLFTGPIYFYILVNAVLCISAIIKIVQAGNKVTANDKQRTRKKVLAVIKLQIVFGFYWILLPLNVNPNVDSKILYRLLNIFLTLQGVILVLLQFVTLKNINKLKNSLLSLTTSLARPSGAMEESERHTRQLLCSSQKPSNSLELVAHRTKS